MDRKIMASVIVMLLIFGGVYSYMYNSSQSVPALTQEVDSPNDAQWSIEAVGNTDKGSRLSSQDDYGKLSIDNPEVTEDSESIDNPQAEVAENQAAPSETYGPEPTRTPPPLVAYDGRIEHIFFHPLIAYPSMTFDDDYQAKGFDDWFVTVPEFKRVLESLYQKGFILVDINHSFEEIDQQISQKTLMIPEGKRPLVISIDDLNYYEYMIQNGMVHKLVIGDDGDIATFSITPEGQELVSKDNEIVPILDEFVKKHPDFSHEGAKGVLALTGYEGVLGYRTHADSPNREEEIMKVMPIIKRLKETGWNFASHSYSHNDLMKISQERLREDSEKWANEVQSLIGDTKIYIYPYGSGPREGDSKLEILKEFGFRAFYHVGIESYYKYTKGSLVADRRHIDGISLRYQRSINLDLYDADQIIDPIRPAKYQLKPNK